MMAYNELYGLGWDYYKKYLKHIEAVNQKDVQRVARKYLNPEKEVLVLTTKNAARSSAN